MPRSVAINPCAGAPFHEATVLLVKPRDGHRYGYRLWSEKASGLLLRVDVLGEGGSVVETSAFSDVAIGVRAQGVMDAGITGLDWVLETRAKVKELADLRAPWPNYRQVRWVLAVRAACHVRPPSLEFGMASEMTTT